MTLPISHLTQSLNGHFKAILRRLTAELGDMLVLEHFQILDRIYAIPIERYEGIGALYGSQPQLKTLEHDVQFE